ncbi:unnamed protein product, partial [Rotaria socialis]
ELQMHASSIQEVNIETSTPTPPNENSLYLINIEQKIIRSRNRMPSSKPPKHISSAKKTPKNISASQKHPYSPDARISPRLKRAKKKKNKH